MLAELFKAVAEMAVRASEARRLDIRDPRHARYLTAAGTPLTIDLPAPPRSHLAGSLDDLIALAARFDGSEGPGGDPLAPVVWYDAGCVQLIIDDDGHRAERAAFTLHPSEVFETVESLAESKKWHDQKAFVRLLRIDLAGTLDPVVLLEKVRKVRFEGGQSTTSEVRRDRESLGRQITSKVEAEGGEIPEEVTLSVPVYSDPGERDRYPVRCSVEVDSLAGTFRLMPLPDELERVRQMAVSAIADRLRAALPEGVPAYRGTP